MLNLWRANMLIFSSIRRKKWLLTHIKARAQEPLPYLWLKLNGQNQLISILYLWPKQLKNHTLWGCTYLYTRRLVPEKSNLLFVSPSVPLIQHMQICNLGTRILLKKSSNIERKTKPPFHIWQIELNSSASSDWYAESSSIMGPQLLIIGPRPAPSNILN